MSATHKEVLEIDKPSSEEIELGELAQLDVKEIRPYKDNPRHFFEPEELRTLGASLKRKQRMPIKVKRIYDDPDGFKYELIDGERRLRAALLTKIKSLKALILLVGSEREQYLDSVVTNLCRAGHTPLEKAEALNKLHKMGMSREDLADECGYSIGWVDQHLSLMRLEPEVQALMDPERPKEKQLPFALALRLVPLPPQLQREIAEEIVNKKIPLNHARFLIQSRTHEAGYKLNKNRMPYKDYKIITGFVERLRDETQVMMAMPNPVFIGMLSSRSENDVEILTGQIEDAILNLTQLSDKLRSAKGLKKKKRT